MLFSRQEDIFVLVCRPALPKDTADVMALTSRIWEGHDYVPYYWQDWLEDPIGLLAVAEYGGRVVGLTKLSRYGDDQWWLQGLRVNPEYQGRGIASRLHHYMLDYWERHCGGILRLATSSARLPVHHLCEQTGFHKAGEYLSYIAPPLDELADALIPLEEREAVHALEIIQRSEMFSLANGLIDLNWQWGEPDVRHIIEAAREGRAFWRTSAAGERGVVVCDEDDEEGEADLFLQIIGCLLADLSTLLMDFRSLASQRGCLHAAWMAPVGDEIRQAMISAGFTRDWDHSLYLYEKRLPAKDSARVSSL